MKSPVPCCQPQRNVLSSSVLSDIFIAPDMHSPLPGVVGYWQVLASHSAEVERLLQRALVPVSLLLEVFARLCVNVSVCV